VRRSARTLSWTSLGASVWLLSGCGLLQSAQSSKVIAGTVLSTPNYDLSGVIGANLPDAGIPLPLPDGGGAALPAQVVAQIFFGDRDPGDPTKAPTGVSGASVKLSFSGKSLDLKDLGGGNYSLTSLDAADLVYQPGTAYSVAVASAGTTYSATVTSPSKETIQQFHILPDGVPMDISANHDLVLTRSATDNVASTAVEEASAALLTRSGTPTYTDAPQAPLDLLDLVANDGSGAEADHRQGLGLPHRRLLLPHHGHSPRQGDALRQPVHRLGLPRRNRDMGLAKAH